MGIDEAYLMYSRAENAALMIQKNFRDRYPELAKETDDHSDKKDDYLLESEEEEESQPSPQAVITSIFIALTMFVPILMGWISKCIRMLNRGSDGIVDDGGMNHIAGGGANGGGGGGGGNGNP